MLGAPLTAPSPSALTRRSAMTTTAAGALAVTVAGCSTRPASGPGNDAPASADLGTDEQIVVDLVAHLDASLILLRRTRRAFPALPLAPLQAALRAHRDTLRGAARHLPSTSASGTTTQPAATRDAALAQVRTDATALQQTCLDAAVRAESGAFARLLASMGCGVSQRLVGLPA